MSLDKNRPNRLYSKHTLLDAVVTLLRFAQSMLYPYVCAWLQMLKKKLAPFGADLDGKVSLHL